MATTTKKNKPEKKEKHLHTQKTQWKSVKISIHLWYWHRGKIHPELPTTQNNLNIKYEWKCERFNRAKINSTLWKTTRVFICVTVNDLMHQGKEIYVFVFHFIWLLFRSVQFGSVPFHSFELMLVLFLSWIKWNCFDVYLFGRLHFRVRTAIERTACDK